MYAKFQCQNSQRAIALKLEYDLIDHIMQEIDVLENNRKLSGLIKRIQPGEVTYYVPTGLLLDDTGTGEIDIEQCKDKVIDGYEIFLLISDHDTKLLATDGTVTFTTDSIVEPLALMGCRIIKR